jgi:hypothetical protein
LLLKCGRVGGANDAPTVRFSTKESAIVRVTMPSDILSASDRIPIFCRIDEYNPRLIPYMIVNGNRKAFYYVGGDGIVNIRSDHLRPGKNELLFSEQSTTGVIIFIHEMRHLQPQCCINNIEKGI